MGSRPCVPRARVPSGSLLGAPTPRPVHLLASVPLQQTSVGPASTPADARLMSLVAPACIQLLAPHLLQQRQLGEELVGAVLSQEVGPLLAGLGVGAAEVLEEAGLGQGGRDGVLALLVWECQPIAPGQPPGEALQGGTGVGEDPGPGPFSLAQLEPEHTSLPPAAVWAQAPLSCLIQGVSHR